MKGGLKRVGDDWGVRANDNKALVNVDKGSCAKKVTTTMTTIIIIIMFFYSVIFAWRMDVLYKTYNKCNNKYKCKLYKLISVNYFVLF